MLNGFFIVCLVVLGLYCAHIGRFILGLFQLRDQDKTFDFESSIKLNISVLVVFRNESSKIRNLLNSLNALNYPQDKVEFIFVNDESDDNSYQIVQESISEFRFKLKLFQSQGGKKVGLKLAMEKAENEIIVCTDADCVVSTLWLHSMVKEFENPKIKMVLGPLTFRESGSILQKFFALEFISLIASTAGSTFFHQSIMANGGNLAYRKAVFNELKSNSNKLQISSGDDMFLLGEIKRVFGPSSIAFSYLVSSEVTTESPKSAIDFINQRVRWISKSKSYSDTDMLFSTLLIGLTNFLLLVSTMIATIIQHFEYALFFWGLKALMDFVLLASYTHDFKRKKLLWVYPILTILYPFYVCSIGFLGFFFKPKWKGRQLNT